MKKTTIDFIQKAFDENKSNRAEFTGECHDCQKTVKLLIEKDGEETLRISGGALYQIHKDNGDTTLFFKCDKCFGQNSTLTDYQDCEVYSRSVGYLRPVKQWNEGKQSEFKNRKMHNLKD